MHSSFFQSFSATTNETEEIYNLRGVAMTIQIVSLRRG